MTDVFSVLSPLRCSPGWERSGALYLSWTAQLCTASSDNSQHTDTMASGVKVDEAVKIKYDDIKKKKTHRYLVFYIKDEKMICVEKVGGRDAPYSSFLADLKAAGDEDCR